MDNVLIATLDVNIFEKMFTEVPQIFPQWALEITPGKILRGGSLNYLGLN